MDNTFPYRPSKIAKDFSDRIRAGSFGLKNTDASSVLEFLYMAYTDVQGRDPKKIDQGFVNLENHLSKAVSLEENNEIFGIVCGPHNGATGYLRNSSDFGAQSKQHRRQRALFPGPARYGSDRDLPDQRIRPR